MRIWGSPRSQYQTSGNLVKIDSVYPFLKCLSYHNIRLFDSKTPNCSFYDRSSPIYTQPRYLPPSKMLDADITDSVIGEGCVIKVTSLRAGWLAAILNCLRCVIPSPSISWNNPFYSLLRTVRFTTLSLASDLAYRKVQS